mmetsp:Transcript_6243/g.13742  ORF Transcript_6243/g.13742 Transcript_6243/m.13742 type:complete len:196 (+) Transcript_6243:113-700(+)
MVRQNVLTFPLLAIPGALLASVLCSPVSAVESRHHESSLVIHQKVPRSKWQHQHQQGQLRAQAPVESSHFLAPTVAHAEGLLQSAQTPVSPQGETDLSTAASRTLQGVQHVETQVGVVLQKESSANSMMQTQLLANGMSMNVVKKLADTVAHMKSEVEKLETHVNLCKKKVADLQSSREQKAADQRLAESPTVVR